MKRLSILIVALAMSVAVFGQQVPQVKTFVEQHEDLDSYFIYQSTLRLLNPNGNEDFNMLIRNVKKINAYVSEGANDVEAESFVKMIADLEADGFELLIRAKYDGAMVSLLGQDKGKDSYYVLGVHDTDDFALLEMDGSLDLSYINALQNVDFGKLSDIILQSDSKNVSDQ